MMIYISFFLVAIYSTVASGFWFVHGSKFGYDESSPVDSLHSLNHDVNDVTAVTMIEPREKVMMEIEGKKGGAVPYQVFTKTAVNHQSTAHQIDSEK